MAAVLLVGGVALALLTVLVAGLLRSHAEILRALHELGVDLDPSTSNRPGMPRPATEHRTYAGGTAHDIAGVDPDGDPVAIGIAGANHDTLLAFLTSSCQTCLDFWNAFARRRTGADLPDGIRIVIVAKSPTDELPVRLAELAPPHVPVVLSNQAWEDYGVPVAPYFIHVDGPNATVRGEGAASTWNQVVSLLGDALGESSPRPRRRSNRRAREDRADAALRAAGVEPDHPDGPGNDGALGPRSPR